MKRIITLIALVGTAIGLTGCELNNDEMENIISKCKDDVECKAILDREIDEALEERGIFGEDEDWDEYDIFYDLELNEEELALVETLEALDMEVDEVLDNMTDEEIEALEVQEVEIILGRALTDEEIQAIQIVESLYEFEYEDEFEMEDVDFEVQFLEFYLGRTLTEEELAALDVIYAYDDVAGVSTEPTTEEEEAFDLIDALYDEAFDMTEQEELELFLGRTLTQEELDALAVIDAITDEVWETEEFTPEQEYAFEIIDTLYYESDVYFEVMDLEFILGRTLTDEEKVALQTVNNIYMTIDENWEDDDEDFVVDEMVAYYELVLNRELTEEEIDAVEFSVEFFFYDEYEDYDDDWDEEYDDDDDWFDWDDDHEDDEYEDDDHEDDD